MKFFKQLFGIADREVVDESLSGEWHGHYTQHDMQKRIVATFTQDGDRIFGHMADADTVTEQSLYDAVAGAGLPPGADEQIAEQIRAAIPNAATGPIKTRSILPEESKLEGTVSGKFVRFTKSYQGETFHSYEIGEKGIGQKFPGHSVEYSGRLSQDRKTISGKWTIYQSEAPRGFIDGGFELCRVGT